MVDGEADDAAVEGRVDGSLLVLAGAVALALAQTEH